MKTKSENLVDSIFKKLQDYNSKEIYLEKENLKKFIFSLFKEIWILRKNHLNWYSLNNLEDIIMYGFSSLTIILIFTFILSLYFLLKVTSNAKD